jgi:tetratricopeptide (TPR) repeat protein
MLNIMQYSYPKLVLCLLILGLTFISDVANPRDEYMPSIGDQVVIMKPYLPLRAEPDENSSFLTEMLQGVVSRVIATEQDDKGATWVYLTDRAFGWVETIADNEPTLALFSDSLLEQLIESATNTIDADPTALEAYITRGVAYTSLKDYEAAIQDYTHAIEIAPNEGRLHEYRGSAYSNSGNNTQAVIDYRHAIDLGRELGNTYNNLGITFQNMESWVGAANAYEQAILLQPEFGLFYNNRATVYHVLDLHDAAIETYSQAIEVDPYLAVAYINRGDIYGKLNEPDLALADYQTGLGIDPCFSQGYVRRGLFYAQVYQNLSDALNDFNTALELDPDNDRAYTARAMYYLQVGTPDLAISDLKQATRLRPDNDHAHYNLASLYAQLGRYQDALNSYSQAITVGYHYDFGALLYLGQIFVALEDYNMALIDLNRYVDGVDASQPGGVYFETSAYLTRGYIQLYMGDYLAAVEDYIAAFNANSEFALNYYIWGGGYRVTPRRELMIADLQAEINNKPDDCDLYLQLGNLFMEFGRWQEALDAYASYQNLRDSPNPDLESLTETLKDLIQ